MRLVCTLLLLLTGCTQLPAPTKPPIEKDNFSYTRERLSELINTELQKENIAGISIALVAKNDVVWQTGFGYADKKATSRASEHTRYRAGSLAKVMLTLAVLALHDSGQLDIDAPITDYLPNFKQGHSDTPTITLRLLLSHQSGLPSDLIKGMWTHQPAHYHSTLTYLKNTTFPHAPNELHVYSNLGFNLVAAIIEARTQTPIVDYMNAFLARLEMHQSAFSASPTSPPTAQSYNRGRQTIELSLRDVPAAGLSTSAADLARFYQHLLSGDIDEISNATLNEMFKDHSSHLPLNFGKRVGLGLFHYEGIFHPRFPIFGHNGATVNHRSVIKFSRDERYGVALLSNDRAAMPALHRIANTALRLMHEASTGQAAPHHSSYWPRVNTEDSVDTKTLSGHYASAFGLIKIYPRGKRMYANVGGKRLRLYQRESNGLYYLRYRLFGIFPIDLGYMGRLGFALRKINNDHYLIAKTTYGTLERVGVKLRPQKIPDAWQKRVGKYTVVNPLTVINLSSGGITIEDGFLIAYAQTDRGDNLRIALTPINDYEAKVTGIGRGLGEHVKVINASHNEQLIYSNILFKKKK